MSDDLLTPDEWGLVSLMLQRLHAAGPPYDPDEVRARLVEYFGDERGGAVMEHLWSLDTEGERAAD